MGGKRAFLITRFKFFPDRKSTRLNSSHSQISYAVFCLKKNKVLLDGIPLNEIGGTVDFGGVFTTGIEQVVVLRGPNSGLYWAYVPAGVVNLTTASGTTF